MARPPVTASATALTTAGHWSAKPPTEPFLPSPTLLLTGHKEAVYSLSFDPTGCYLASAGMDRTVMLWDVKGGGHNYNILEGHKNAVLEVKFLDTSRLVTCSADKTVALWDANKGVRIRKWATHSAIVNCCAVAGPRSPHTFASGSDDATVVVWDTRTKEPAHTAYHDYQVRPFRPCLWGALFRSLSQALAHSHAHAHAHAHAHPPRRQSLHIR